MRFVQVDSVFGQLDWSGTLDSYVKKTGQRPFTDFDYSNFSDLELRFLNFLLDADKRFIGMDYDKETGQRYIKRFIISGKPISNKKWYLLDSILNFAPTDSEIFKSINGDKTLWQHPIAAEQITIVSSQMKNIVGLESSDTFSKYVVDAAKQGSQSTFTNGSSNPIVRANQAIYGVDQADVTIDDFLISSGGVPTGVSSVDPAFFTFKKIDLFDPFAYNMIITSLIQTPFYMLWLASTDGTTEITTNTGQKTFKTFKEIAKEYYGISVEKNKQNNSIKIKVEPTYTALLKAAFQSPDPTVVSDILPYTENIQTPFISSKGIPRLSANELVFYLRLFHGIGSAHDQEYSETPGFVETYNTLKLKKQNVYANSNTLEFMGQFENKQNIWESKFPFRMRYENQFLLPEPFVSKELFLQGQLYWKTKFERPNIHFIANKNSIVKTINPNNGFNNRYSKENKNYWYYGLWCHAVVDDSFNGLRKYYPTGFSRNSYEVYDTEVNNSTLKNYTQAGIISDVKSDIDSITNVTYWFDSTDSISDGFENITKAGTKMTQNGPRGGIPVNYLSLLRLESEIKGRFLLKELENFTKCIEDGITKKEILPVVYGVDNDYNDVSTAYGTNKDRLFIKNDVFETFYKKQFKQINSDGTTVPAEDLKNMTATAYISNIKSPNENHPYFKYHDRPWNRVGTGVYPKLGDPFSAQTWVSLFCGQHILSRVYPKGTFTSDFPASFFTEKSLDNLCSPQQDIMYPRPLIEPDLQTVFSQKWQDTTEGSTSWDSLYEFETKIFLVILHAAITSIKKFSHLKSANELAFGNNRESSEFALTIEQRKIIEQASVGYYFNGNKIKNAKELYNFIRNSENPGNPFAATGTFIDKTLQVKKTEQVYWGLNAVTALAQMSHSITKRLDKATDISLIFPKFMAVDKFMYETMYDKVFKLGSNYYKVMADVYSFILDPTWPNALKSSATIVNAVISLHIVPKKMWIKTTTGEIILSTTAAQLESIGIGKNTFGWIVTGFFLVVGEVLDRFSLAQKQEKLKNKFIEAYEGGYIEGPYVQTGGTVKIKKTATGKLPVAYDESGKPIEYQSIQSGSIKSYEETIIRSYGELMGDTGEKNFWQVLTCEDARVLKRIIEDDFKRYGTYGSFEKNTTDPNSAPRVTDIAPNHYDIGIYTTDRKSSLGIYNSAIARWLPQYDGITMEDQTVPYVNVKLLTELYLNTRVGDGITSSAIVNFVPNFKYWRSRHGINRQENLIKYFNGTYTPEEASFGLKLINFPIDRGGSLKEVSRINVDSNISDSEKIYLIRKKYGLDLINKDFGNQCCNMSKEINTEDEYSQYNWPNDGKLSSDWTDYTNLPINSVKRKSLTRYKEISTGKEVQGCEYLVTLSTEAVYNRLLERITECEKGSECFSGETLVMTPFGERPIMDISIGDEVTAFDADGNIHVSTVTNVFHHDNKSKLFRYTLDNGINLEITKNHPVLTSSGDFVEIGQLLIGDYLVTKDLTLVKIVNIEFLREDFTYNMTVEKYSTYIANGIRVHNKPVPAPEDNVLPVSRYNDDINSFVESLIEVKDINEPKPDLTCVELGICNDVTCVNCNPSPRFIRSCSIPELCFPPKIAGSIPGSIPAWLFDWIQYDFRTNWSGVVKTFTDLYSWWTHKEKPINIDIRFNPLYEVDFFKPSPLPIKVKDADNPKPCDGDCSGTNQSTAPTRNTQGTTYSGNVFSSTFDPTYNAAKRVKKRR